MVGTMMLGSEPGEHLQHLMPIQMPAWVTEGDGWLPTMTWQSMSLQRCLLRSVA